MHFATFILLRSWTLCHKHASAATEREKNRWNIRTKDWQRLQRRFAPGPRHTNQLDRHFTPHNALPALKVPKS